MLNPPITRAFDISLAFIVTFALLYFITSIIIGYIDEVVVLALIWCTVVTSFYLVFRNRLRQLQMSKCSNRFIISIHSTRILIIALMILTLFSSIEIIPVFAVEYHVNSGDTIQNFINTASPGDIITVHPGTYARALFFSII